MTKSLRVREVSPTQTALCVMVVVIQCSVVKSKRGHVG